jgi:hypothetical protein
MKFNQLTYNISMIMIIVTALYTLIYSGLTGIILCTAVTLIVASFVNQFEMVAAVGVIFALFYTFYLKRLLRRFEPFQNQDTPNKIMGRISGMEKGYSQPSQQLQNPNLEPAGVYNPAIEGFEDVQPQVPKDGESQASSNAPSKRNHEVDPKQIKEVTSAVLGAKKTSDDISKEEFQSATNGLFKLGKMPSEHMDGPNLDSGSTLMKAMENFKPEQVTAMTDDTKKLLETQKGLMNMLTQMRPVLADGKELLQTFSGMFGSGGPVKL